MSRIVSILTFLKSILARSPPKNQQLLLTNKSDIVPLTLDLFKMAQNDLVRQLQKNHEVLVQKISFIESKFAEQLKNPKCSTLVDKSSTPEKPEFERQRLQLENQQLRNEIQTLTRKLIHLESMVKGQDQVLSTDDLKKIQCLNTSTIVATPVVIEKPEESETKTEDKKQQSSKKQEQKQKPQKEKQQQQLSDQGKNQKESKPAPVKSGKEQIPAEDRQIDASRLDLRVGKIIDVKKHPDADSLYVEQIECGEEKPRTVVSGLVKFVPLEEMQNRMVIVLCNLKPAKMRGIVSEAMVMCASTPEKVEILTPPEGSVPGDRVSFQKYPGQPDQQLNPKKKIWEQIAPDLKTNDNLEATYKGDSFIVEGKGTVKAQTLKNVQVK